MNLYLQRRTLIVLSVLSGAFLVLYIRLFDIMVVNHSYYEAYAQKQYFGHYRPETKRGNIYDRQGRVLAIDIDGYSIYLKKTKSIKKDTLKDLSEALGIPFGDIKSKLNQDKDRVILTRHLPPERAVKVKASQYKAFVELLPEPLRVYPKGPLASHILGFVGAEHKGLE
ncbi:MAG: hypothetical protein D6778_06495, partial [Nitrospirae bacterium]